MIESNPNWNWYQIDNIDELDSPALVVYPERVKANISTAISMIEDVRRLRPHVKTNKAIEPTKLMITAGINKFKCATIAEAEMLGMCQAADVLLAYQPNGPKLQRFIAVIKKYPATKYSCLTDNITAAQQMAAIFYANGLNIPVFIDLNLGMNRTGIATGEAAVQLYIACVALSGINPVGLHGYDGHIRDVDFNARKQKCDEVYLKIETIQKNLSAKGFAEPIIVMGGSPGFSVYSKRKNIECSPGTFIYWDKGIAIYVPNRIFSPPHC